MPVFTFCATDTKVSDILHKKDGMMAVFKKAKISRGQREQNLARIVTAFIHDNMENVQQFLLERPTDGRQIMHEELEAFVKEHLKEILERKISSLSPADAADTINSFLYVINHYKSPRSALLNHRLKQVRNKVGGQKVIFEAGEKPWPDIHSLLVEDMPVNLNNMIKQGTLAPDSITNPFLFRFITRFKRKYGTLVTPEHDRTLFMAVQLLRIADQEERDLVMSIFEDIHEYADRLKGHHYNGDFFIQFELSFMFLRDLLKTVTCDDFVDSMVNGLRN